MGLIRTKTYIKYARINLQEAEAALEAGDHQVCARKVLFCTDALIKAVAAALPMVKADFFSMSQHVFAKRLEDLFDTKDVADKIASDIFEARKHAQDQTIDRIRAQKALDHAGSAFTNLHETFC